MAKVLFLTPYPLDYAASQRFRFEQYLKLLGDYHIDYDCQSFLNYATWKLFYNKGHLFPKILGVLKGIIKRHLLLFSLYKYNFVFIHREACFIGPPYFEWLYSKVFRKKIIFDFDDAIWLKDVSAANRYLSWLKNSEKTFKIISYSHIVIAGNHYLKNYALQYNSSVVLIPTTIDTAYHFIQAGKVDNKKIIIGWTGSVTTNRHFEMLLPVLKKIATKYQNKIEFRTISNKETEHYGLPVRFKKWEKENEIQDLSAFDIGIMPLPDDEWTKGKCGFKGLQYMALEIPTIMSPVGVNIEIIDDGINGFLASTEEEWVAKLSELIESKELREKIGKEGRKTIVKQYSVDANKQKYLDLFNQLLNSNL